VAAAGLLHADLGLIMLFGLVCAIPAWVLGGYFYSRWIARRIFVPIPSYVEESFHDEYDEQGLQPIGEPPTGPIAPTHGSAGGSASNSMTVKMTATDVAPAVSKKPPPGSAPCWPRSCCRSC
jgi:hypothetical protein